MLRGRTGGGEEFYVLKSWGFLYVERAPPHGARMHIKSLNSPPPKEKRKKVICTVHKVH